LIYLELLKEQKPKEYLNFVTKPKTEDSPFGIFYSAFLNK